MSTVLSNVLKPWGFDSNKFLDSLRPDQRKKKSAPKGMKSTDLIRQACSLVSALRRQFSHLFFSGHHPEAVPLSHNSHI